MTSRAQPRILQKRAISLTAPGEIRIGISGWTYGGWRGRFYPEKLPHNRELSYAAGIFRSIEINGTFYSLQRPATFAKWADATPDDFVFAIKGSRFITHVQRLKEVRAPLANFFASGVLRLGPKLGPFLWQLPPNFKFDAKRIENFLKILPRDTDSARALARRHDKRVSGRSWIKSDEHRPLRHSIEIRNRSFVVPDFVELLRRYGAALVCADTVEWPRLMDLTADFIYCRLHGSEQLYASGYDDRALDVWAQRVAAWARGGEPNDAERVIARPAPSLPKRDVYVYFDNDAKVRAPFDAQALTERVKRLSPASSSASAAAQIRGSERARSA
jgi:uncharacterized protein YecE (DUF72 family)